MSESKNVMIVAHFCDYGMENTNNRFNYIASVCAESGYDVELITSSFCHRTKTQRKELSCDSAPYRSVLIEEPSYRRNISLKRLLYSHKKFASNLTSYLRECPKPDVVYCAVPSLDVAEAAAKYCNQNDIPFIIDVQDLWPEAFKLVFHVPLLSNLVFAPMEVQANKIYAQADAVVAVSQTYANRALSANKKCREGHVVYLGTRLSEFDKNIGNRKNRELQKDEFIIVYCGTLGHSYDLHSTIDAMAILKNRGHENVKLLVMGDGPLRAEFEQYADKMQVNTEFTGYLSYADMVSKLAQCDIAVNPISHGAAQSIINKHGDYAMAGIPVVSTQESVEYRNLVDEYQMGFNCENGNATDMANKIEILLDSPERREKMGRNARRCAEEKFDRAVAYKRILHLMESIAK